MSSVITQTSAFSPLSLSNCGLWLDASDPTTCLKSGSTVTNWNDKSGNGRNISITGTLTFSNASGNTGAANSVNTASNLTSYFTTPMDLRKTVNSNVSVFMVYAWLGQSGTGSQTFWGNDAPNAANRVQFFNFDAVYSPNSYGYFLNNGYLTNTAQLNRSSTQMYELISQVGVTNGTGVYFNGVLGSAGFGSEVVNSPAAGNEILYFGGGETSSIYPSYTQFNEILIYTSALTPGQRQQIEGYLAWKWSLVSLLSAQHPFKYFPPNQTPSYRRVPFTNLESFTPLYISGCRFWIDAQDPTTVTSNIYSVITRVRDKSGNGFNLTNNMTTFGFTYNYEAFFNGSYPSFYNQNGAQTYTLGSNSSFSLTQPATIFTVHQIVGTNSFQDVLDSTNATNRFFIYYYVPSVPAVSMRLFAGTNLVTTFATFNPGVFSYSLNTTTSFYSQNGSNLQAGDIGTNSMTGITIGSRYTQNEESFVGHICEVLLYNRLLTTREIQRVEGYLAWKWGLQTSLPSTHPYRNTSNNNPGPFGPVYNFNQRRWLPTQVSGCSLWLDGLDTSTLTLLSGSNVSQWNDKSGNARNAVVSSNAYATYSNSGLYFNNSLYTTGLSADPTSETGFVVFNNPSNIGLGYFIGAYNGGREIGNYGSGTQVGILKSLVAWGPVTDFPSYGVRYVVTSIVSPTATTILTNGGTGSNSVGAFTFNSGSNTILGREAGTSAPVTGFMHEVIFYNSVLSTFERQQVEGYLAWKWGIQGYLPISHPYRFIPPSPP